MKKPFILSLIILIILANTSYADTTKRDRYCSLGVGAYSQVFSFDVPETQTDNLDDVKFSGGGLSLTMAIGKSAAVRIGAYQLEEIEDDNIKTSEPLTINGGEALLLIGSNFTKPGGNIYIGIGAFSEKLKLEDRDLSETYSGAMASLGFGYNWDVFLLDLHVNIKDTEDFKETVLRKTDDTEIVNASAMLTLGIRF